ncbi:hypothetical protein GWI33_004459 [Rhynchophorus ferrugineus]|uniref:Uncharacterized protein n=1 Tax=Rhynchophorus ferrugineus TaxID=354439 RepID=A0A834IIS8_RHYFE|nr:hypothetical protein GWI33_004459 [Rhynchophorus ferrugineus]
MGFIGLWRKNGSAYFAAYTVFLTTICIFQFVDILISVVFFRYRMLKPESVHHFLAKRYSEYGKGRPTIDYRVDVMHYCLKCCGIKSPFEKEVIIRESIIRYIIPSCCPYKKYFCTPFQAYKDNCSSRLIIESVDYFIYIKLAVINFKELLA